MPQCTSRSCSIISFLGLKKLSERYIRVPIEYQSVCLIVGIGSPTPYLQANASTPLEPVGTMGGGGQHSLAGEGVAVWGYRANSYEWIEAGALYTLWTYPKGNFFKIML